MRPDAVVVAGIGRSSPRLARANSRPGDVETLGDGPLVNAGRDEDLLRIELGELRGLGADLGSGQTAHWSWADLSGAWLLA